MLHALHLLSDYMFGFDGTKARAAQSYSLVRFYDLSVTGPAFLMIYLHYVWPKPTRECGCVLSR